MNKYTATILESFKFANIEVSETLQTIIELTTNMAVRDGRIQGYKNVQEAMDVVEKVYQDHDCHTSPEDGCEGCVEVGKLPFFEDDKVIIH